MGLFWLQHQAASTTFTPGGTAVPPTQAEIYEAAVLALSPVAYFTMNEDGATLADASSNANHGTYTGSPTTITGPFAGCVGRTFDGSTQYAQAPHHAAYSVGTSDFSIVLWAYIGTTWPAVSSWPIGHGGNGENTSWEVYLRGAIDNSLRSRIGGVTSTSSATTDISTAGWHMVALCADRSGNAAWFVDNVANGTTDISAGVAVDISMDTTLYIARRNAGSYLAGSVAQVSVHAAALTAGNISTLWTAAGGV